MGYYEFTIAVADESREALTNRLTEMGCLGSFERDGAMVAYFPDTIDLGRIRDGLLSFQSILRESGLSHDLSFHEVTLSERDWNEAWKKTFRPLDIGENLTILPPWEEENPLRINLIIDPGMAFGTGHHETTRRCLMLIETVSREGASLNHRSRTGGLTRFLDVGTGTGVLAVAASRLGYHEVIGLDTDPLALDAARRNVELNGLRNVQIRAGSISDVRAPFDVIAANLISEVLIGIAADVACRLKPSGLAIFSGMLSGQENDVIEAIERAGLTVRETLMDERWVSLVLVHRG